MRELQGCAVHCCRATLTRMDNHTLLGTQLWSPQPQSMTPFPGRLLRLSDSFDERQALRKVRIEWGSGRVLNGVSVETLEIPEHGLVVAIDRKRAEQVSVQLANSVVAQCGNRPRPAI